MRIEIPETTTTTPGPAVAQATVGSTAVSDGDAGQDAHVARSRAAPVNDVALQSSLVSAMGQLSVDTAPGPPLNHNGKFYVVFRGHQPGIYTTLAESQRQTLGFSGCLHQSFTAYDRALEEYQGYIASEQASRAASRTAEGTNAPVDRQWVFVVICGEKPGVYLTLELATNALGNASSCLFRRANTVAEANAAFVQSYMAGEVLKN
ncbi:hypothetical protein BDN72DRAFT_905885 [Pluteus cervinus]|uniref:Uncharacterized protein n=1 Tax=Pluteus cervinus TaxID=181527 RepID=A0ACD3A181_9AGAR|nr:hypothetical protein BDN72DRAFT_905885 [Pluteus cervinus]